MAGRMNQVQAIQLADWLRSNRDVIERTAISEVVESIQTDLGIMANPASVLRIAQSVGIGVRLGQPRPPMNEDQILELATCVADLYQRLGEPCPPQLSHLLGRRFIRPDLDSRSTNSQPIALSQNGMTACHNHAET